jgi:hypothetical protein
MSAAKAGTTGTVGIAGTARVTVKGTAAAVVEEWVPPSSGAT